MSAQTGTAPTSGPVSQRAFDRAKYRVDRLKNEPNPVWIRELKQSARLGRTPILLMVMTAILAVVMTAIGALVSLEYSPATTGSVLFQVFFSLAWFVVTLVGPAMAANSIAAEREGHTWEAVVLTGLPPARIARGKFLASFTAIGSYLVALAPVGALSFLFGGVTATEVVVAFAFLFLLALLSVAFGLAVSSMMERARGAILATVLLSFPISVIGFLTFGVGLSALAHELWPGVPKFLPIWLPMAYERAHFDLLYVVCLFVLPIAVVVVPAWFLYEVTIANLTSVTDDRSSRLKIWFLATAPALAIAAAAAAFLAPARERLGFTLAGASLLATFLTFSVLLFQGDPVGPSRRVSAQWRAAGTSRFRRFLGPGIVGSSQLLLFVGLGTLALELGVGTAATYAGGKHAHEAEAIAAFAVYALGFGVFTVGLGGFLRARISTPVVSRVVLVAILFGLSVAPWIVAAIVGAMTSPEAHAIAAPSPFFAFAVAEAVDKGKTEGANFFAGIGAAGFWAVTGFVLLGASARRCRKIIRDHEAILAETDRILAAEDQAAAAAAEAAANPGPFTGTETETETGTETETETET